MKQICIVLTLVLFQIYLAGCTTCQKVQKRPVRVLVVTGGHSFEEVSFFAMLDSFEPKEVTYEHWPLQNQAEVFNTINPFDADVILLYNMTQKISPEQQQNVITLLKDRGIGLIVMHHAIAAWPQWEAYHDIIGADLVPVQQFKEGIHYQHGVDLTVHVTNSKHPITKGIKDFKLHDETYNLDRMRTNQTALLTTDHPSSDGNLCWAKTYGKAHVCVLQCGHDHYAYENPALQQVLLNAIRWCVKTN